MFPVLRGPLVRTRALLLRRWTFAWSMLVGALLAEAAAAQGPGSVGLGMADFVAADGFEPAAAARGQGRPAVAQAPLSARIESARVESGALPEVVGTMEGAGIGHGLGHDHEPVWILLVGMSLLWFATLQRRSPMGKRHGSGPV